jgi:esterase/lipase superfamily enzyme
VEADVRRLILGLAVVLAGCAARGEFTPVPAGQGAAPEAIFVGTTRAESEGGYGFERSDLASFLRYDISIPPERELGELNWPPRTRAPDPEQDFLVLNEVRFGSAAEFQTALRVAMGLRRQVDAVIYVHGFNTTMAEGVYRVAQMHHDLQVPGVAVHYAWPSRGSALGYLHDRESVLFARSGFEVLLDEVAASGANEIVIVAHSMGAFLTMETLRQMALADGSRALDRVAGVVLISPDLDLDVFRSQARDIGELPQPFFVFGSAQDRVLGLSARISGSGERLGNLEDISKIADLKVTYLETAAFDIGAGHLNLGENPALLKLFGGIVEIDAAFRDDAQSRVGLLPGLVLTVRNATEIVLAPVGAIADTRVGR